MKKLIVLALVLSMATMANAGLKISVDGQIDPPDTQIVLAYSDTVVIDVWSDGQELADAPAFLYISGPGSLDISHAINFVNPPGYSASIDLWTDFPMPGDQVWMDLAIPAIGAVIPLGKAIDGIILHCEGVGEVTLSLYMDRTPNVGGIFELMDTQVIHQIPEPMTMALLGLGGLFLRRRSK